MIEALVLIVEIFFLGVSSIGAVLAVGTLADVAPAIVSGRAIYKDQR